jgi:SNF2 family DNA or RNA helicase
MDVITGFIQDRNNQFGHEDQIPTKDQFVRNTTVTLAVEHVGEFTAALLAADPPSLTSQNVTAQNLFDVRQMWWSRQFLLTRPNDIGRQSQLSMAPFIFSAKEAFLAWKTLTYFYNKRKKIPNWDPASTQKVKAAQPTLLTGKAPVGRGPVPVVASGATRVGVIENALAGLNPERRDRTDLDDPDALDPPTVAAVPEPQYKRLVQGLGSALDNPATAYLGRPALTEADLAVLHSSLCTPRFLEDNVLIYQPPTHPPKGSEETRINTTYTTTTIATSEAITGAADKDTSTQKISDDPDPDHVPDPLSERAVEIVRERQQLQVSAKAPSFDAALVQLGLKAFDQKKSFAILEPANTYGVPATYLKPWQVTAVAWMLNQEASPLRGGLLTDACGLGKTLTALTLIWLANEQRQLEAEAVRDTFAPSLILVPNALVDTWVTEIERHFGDALRLILFFGQSTRTGAGRRKEQTISKLADLKSKLAGLNPKDPKTGVTVIISSYQTWARRTTQLVDEEGNPVRAMRPKSAGTAGPSAGPKSQDPTAEEEEFDEDQLTEDDEEEQEQAEEAPSTTLRDNVRDELAALQDAESTDLTATTPAVRRSYSGLLPAMVFQRVICDEGHRVKTISSRQHQAVARLTRRATWFLTATPMWNKPLDFVGYLSLLWTGIEGTQAADQAPDLNDYQGWSSKTDLPAANLPYHLLAPSGLLALGRKGQLSSQTGFDCLPIILRLTSLCREPGQTMLGAYNVPVVIGGDIPPLAITTVELRYTRVTQVTHDEVYHKLINDLYSGTTENGGDGDGQVAMNWSTYRQLCHLAVHPKLDKFLQRTTGNVLADDIRAFSDYGDDRGFGMFFQRTIEDLAADLPTNRMAVARYLAHDCPRLRFLLHLLWSEGTLASTGARPRFLVYCNWPFTRWLVEMFLSAIGLHFEVIRAGMSQEARSTAIAHFINPESTTAVLLTTFSCGAVGLNMHDRCSRIVLFEGGQNYNSVFQTIGRIHRLGQREPQKAWILFQDHTVQRLIEAKSTKKILPQIAAQFRPWLEGQLKGPPVLTVTSAKGRDKGKGRAKASDDDGDIEMAEAGEESHTEMALDPKPTDPPAGEEPHSDSDDDLSDISSGALGELGEAADLMEESGEKQENQDLEPLAYQVLAEMLGLSPDAPSRLDMDDYRYLGLEGTTRRGVPFSLRGQNNSDRPPVTLSKALRSRKRTLPQPETAGPSKVRRVESSPQPEVETPGKERAIEVEEED